MKLLGRISTMIIVPKTVAIWNSFGLNRSGVRKCQDTRKNKSFFYNERFVATHNKIDLIRSESLTSCCKKKED